MNNIHTSGHGGQQEQKLMLRLIKPKYFMPVHGEYRMLKIHAGLAQDTGVPKENCFIMENGDVLALTKDTARPAGHSCQSRTGRMDIASSVEIKHSRLGHSSANRSLRFWIEVLR